MEKIAQDKYGIIYTEYYSPRKLSLLGILPWSSHVTIAKRLNVSPWKEIFNPITEKKSGRIFKYIKGENIIKFLNMAENGQLNNYEEQ